MTTEVHAFKAIVLATSKFQSSKGSAAYYETLYNVYDYDVSRNNFLNMVLSQLTQMVIKRRPVENLSSTGGATDLDKVFSAIVYTLLNIQYS